MGSRLCSARLYQSLIISKHSLQSKTGAFKSFGLLLFICTSFPIPLNMLETYSIISSGPCQIQIPRNVIFTCIAMYSIELVGLAEWQSESK